MGFEFSIAVKPQGDELKVSPDITRGELRVTTTFNGNSQMVPQGVAKPEAIGDTEVRVVGPFQTDEGIPGKALFVWIDDAGNESKVPATFDFVLNDNIPPLNPDNSVLSIQDIKEI